jgi:hypothetical protein
MLARFLAFGLLTILFVSGVGAGIGYVGMFTGNDGLLTLGQFLALPCFLFMVFLLACGFWGEFQRSRKIAPKKSHDVETATGEDASHKLV